MCSIYEYENPLVMCVPPVSLSGFRKPNWRRNCFFEWVLGNQIEDELPSLLPEATLAATETGVVNLSTVYLNWKKARSTPTPHQSFIQACALTVISRFPSSQTTYPLFHLCLQPPLLLRHPHKNNQQLRLSGSHPYMTFTMPFLICTCVYFD